jgi:hypothetical protein
VVPPKGVRMMWNVWMTVRASRLHILKWGVVSSFKRRGRCGGRLVCGIVAQCYLFSMGLNSSAPLG